jgi:hypothetical protein
VDCFVDQFFLQILWYALDTGKEVEILIDGKGVIDGVELRAVAE